jgi:hypothetical protein
MWQPLQDCGKQLTIHSRLREKLDDGYNLYEIVEVEYDQYHLQLLEKDDTAGESLRQVLNAAQLIEYGFEVEAKA